MPQYQFDVRSVEHRYWMIEADTLEEACARWERLRQDGDDTADNSKIFEDDLVEVRQFANERDNKGVKIEDDELDRAFANMPEDDEDDD